MSLQNRITVVSVCDNHYAIMLAALLKSIELHHKTGEDIDFYIVEDRVSEQNKERLSHSIKSELIHIHWLTMSEIIPDDVTFPLDNSSFPLNIYIRLIIPRFIPESIEKVLYLDVDMILLKDISLLWNVDIGDNIIAAVIDKSEVVSNLWAGILNYKKLGLPADTKYFNSGLLIINTVKWRQANITFEIINCIKENIQFVDFPDQYGLNVVFANKWFELDPLWNNQATSDNKNPYLIHFTGTKPIYTSYRFNRVYKDEFYRFLKLTEWRDYKPVGEYRRLLKRLFNKLEKKIRLLTKKNN